MKKKLTLEEIESKKMSDKDRIVALVCNAGGFANQSEVIQHHTRVGQLLALVEAKQRLRINESLLLANGFEKMEGLGDDVNYLYEIKTPPILGGEQVITHISFRHFDGDAHYELYVEERSTYGEFPSPLPIYNRIEVRIETIQQAEDAINAVGFPFCFSLKGYNAEKP